MSYGGFFEDYGDDYYEPTLAEEIFEEAKMKLEQALKKEFAEKIQEAEKISKRQDEIEAKLFTRECNLDRRERELESKFRDIENEFAKKKLGEFMAMLQKYLGQTYYEVNRYGELKPKCDSCNDDRKIEIKLPDGSIARIDCSCKGYIYRYRVKEKEMLGLHIEKDGRRQKVWLEYKDGSNETNSLYTTSINEKFEDVKDKNSSYKVFYTNKEEAQKHADYLNKLKDSKNGN